MAWIMAVDDDDYILDIIERDLRRQGHRVTCARNGKEALDLLQTQRPDLVILDIVMPHATGIQVCYFMRTHPGLSSVPILFLTAKNRIEDKIEGFESGGDDYLTKPFDLKELSLRIEALLRRTPNSAPTGKLSVGAVTVDPDAAQAIVCGQVLDLTPVEFELLYYLVSHAGEVVPTERLLQEVWGYPPGTGNSSLVRMHVLNLRRKIESDPDNPRILCTVPRHGYVMHAPSS